MSKRAEYSGRKRPERIKDKIDDDRVMMAVVVTHDGAIKTYTADGRGEVDENPSDPMPAGNIGSGTLKFAVEQTNPRCVWVDINGDLVRICKKKN